MELKAIGTIHSPFTELQDMPIQPKGATQVAGMAVLEPHYAEGLADLEGFSHVYLIYQFHKASQEKLKVVPFMDRVERGIFSTRSPVRPNHIGLSIVEITGVEGNVVHLRGIDVLDGTPLLDIKPYIEAFDYVEQSRSGWMQGSRDEVAQRRADDRFLDQD